MALPALQEDLHGTVPYRPNLSEAQLNVLAFEHIEDIDLKPEDRELVEKSRQEAMAALIAKVDSYAAVMRIYAVKAEQARVEYAAQKAELERLKARAERFERHLDRMNDYALYVIRQVGADPNGKYRPLEGETATLKPYRVAPSVEITDEGLVPAFYKKVTLKINALEAKEILDVLAHDPPTQRIFRDALSGGSSECRKSAILMELKRQCETCEGHGFVGESEESEVVCRACGGTGKQRVPGARLIDNALRLVVE